MIEYFLDWDAIIEGPSSDIKKKNRRMLLFNHCIHSNYMYLVGWYYLIDMGSIYPTSLELVAYFLIFLSQSYVLASVKIIDKFIAEVIDAQISFTTTMTLSKNLVFKERIHKVIAFQNILNSVSKITAAFIVWALWDGDENGKLPWIHIVFLTYPPLTNYFLILIQQKTFQSKLFESKVFAVESGSRF
jgi:hypothetical protein